MSTYHIKLYLPSLAYMCLNLVMRGICNLGATVCSHQHGRVLHATHIYASIERDKTLKDRRTVSMTRHKFWKTPPICLVTSMQFAATETSPKHHLSQSIICCGVNADEVIINKKTFQESRILLSQEVCCSKIQKYWHTWIHKRWIYSTYCLPHNTLPTGKEDMWKHR